MNGRRAIVGLCMLCALLVSAFAAQSASAVTKGTTMFTCVEGGGLKDWGDAHCSEGTGKFGHVEVAENTTTHTTYKNTSIQKFESTVAGTKFALTSESLHGTGSATNLKEAEGEDKGEHWIHGTNIELTYSEVKTTVPKCGVSGVPAEPKGGPGMVTTKPLTATTTTKGDSLVLSPMEGEVLAEFQFTGAECPLVSAGTVKVVGSITCKPKGATLTCNHEEVTTAGTLRLGSKFGTKAGYDGTSTVTGADKVEETTKPLSVTTVETA